MYSDIRPNRTIPAFQGDSAKTLFLYNVKSSIILKRNPVQNEYSDYCSYLRYRYGIANPIEYHKQMIEEGYLVLCDYRERLLYCTVAELKMIASNFRLKKTGNKQVLVNTIMTNLTEEQVSSFYKFEYIYKLSELGETWLREHQQYLDCHFTRNIGIDESIHQKVHEPPVSYAEYYGKAEQELLKCMHNPGERRRFLWSDLLKLYRKYNNQEGVLKAVIHILYFDLNDPYKIDGVEKWQDEARSLHDIKTKGYVWEDGPNEDDALFTPCFAPGLVGCLTDYSDQYADNPEPINRLIHNIYHEFPMPYTVYSELEFRDIISKLMSAETDCKKLEMELSRPWPKA